MTDAITEMGLAAELTQHEDFMGLCEGGFPLIAFVDHCRFCSAGHAEKCKRRDSTQAVGGAVRQGERS